MIRNMLLLNVSLVGEQVWDSGVMAEGGGLWASVHLGGWVKEENEGRVECCENVDVAVFEFTIVFDYVRD